MAIVDELIAVLGYEIQDEAAAKRYEQSIERLNKRLSGFAAGAAMYGVLAASTMGLYLVLSLEIRPFYRREILEPDSRTEGGFRHETVEIH